MLASHSILLVLLLPQVYCDCFLNQQCPGKRDILQLSAAVDIFHCKILCFLNPLCQAFIFNATLQGCAQLGKFSGLTCSPPIREWIRTTTDCPPRDPGTTIDGTYSPNPAIDVSYMLPTQINTVGAPGELRPCGDGWRAIDLILPDKTHKVVSSNNGVGLAWDAELGAFYFVEGTNIRTHIRSASCFQVNFSDARAIDTSACKPIEGVTSVTGGYGPPVAPFNRTWPCDDPRANSISFLAWGDYVTQMEKNQARAWINCVYGSWLWVLEPVQTRGLLAATCV